MVKIFNTSINHMMYKLHLGSTLLTPTSSAATNCDVYFLYASCKFISGLPVSLFTILCSRQVHLKSESASTIYGSIGSSCKCRS